MRKVMPTQPMLQDGHSSIQREEAEQPPSATPAHPTDENPILNQIQILLAQDGLQAKSAPCGLQVTDGFEAVLSGTKGGGQANPRSREGRDGKRLRSRFQRRAGAGMATQCK